MGRSTVRLLQALYQGELAESKSKVRLMARPASIPLAATVSEVRSIVLDIALEGRSPNRMRAARPYPILYDSQPGGSARRAPQGLQAGRVSCAQGCSSACVPRTAAQDRPAIGLHTIIGAFRFKTLYVQSQYERLGAMTGADLLCMKCATGQPTQRVKLGASASCWRRIAGLSGLG